MRSGHAMPGLLRVLSSVGLAAGFGAGLYFMLPALPAPPPVVVRTGSGPAAGEGVGPAAPPAVHACACDGGVAGTAGDAGASPAPEPLGDADATPPGDATAPPGRSGPPDAAPAPSAGGRGTARVDLNRASASDLQALPGIGPTKAQRIVESRAERPFERPEDLVRVKGIGPKTVRRLLPLVTVGDP